MSLNEPFLPPAGIIANMSKADRDTLSSYGTFHIAQPGYAIIEQGKPHGKLFFTISGSFHARRKDAGSDILLGKITTGDWIGEVDIFDPCSAVCTVIAMEPSQYWVITRKSLEEYINNYQTAGNIILIGLASTLGRRVRDITQKLSEQSELSKIRESLFHDVPASEA
jgi:CRP-like cAMP-binding protein